MKGSSHSASGLPYTGDAETDEILDDPELTDRLLRHKAEYEGLELEQIKAKIAEDLRTGKLVRASDVFKEIGIKSSEVHTNTQGSQSISLLNLPEMPPLEIWEELADEARNYLHWLGVWRELQTGSDPKALENCEQELLGSLSHLRVHSEVMSETIEEALDLADQVEEARP